VLDAYAAGVNAFVSSQPGFRPIEFILLGIQEWQPWTPPDSLVWVKLMSLQVMHTAFSSLCW
jgi:acyl-homoserine lactone acylase PvdQ